MICTATAATQVLFLIVIVRTHTHLYLRAREKDQVKKRGKQAGLFCVFCLEITPECFILKFIQWK